MKRFITLGCVCALVACGGGSSTDAGLTSSAPSPSTPSAYTLGGSISGLDAGVIALSNGTETLTLAANASGFTFNNPVQAGTAYRVDVTGQPAGLYCSAKSNAGTMPGANVSTVSVQCAAPPALALFAGNLGGEGSIDGVGAAAAFGGPRSVAVDTTGNVYVADAYTNTIRKITPNGVVSTLAGAAGESGSTDGTATARFYGPRGIATDAAGNIYVADTDNHTVRKITPNGVVSTLAGSAGVYGSADGPGPDARFNSPEGIATDRAGNVYVADTGNHTIRKITPSRVVSTVAGNAGVAGSSNGASAAATFRAPAGITTDSVGDIYVADTGNHTVRKITTGLVISVAGTAGIDGSADETGAAALFQSPRGIATDSAGNIYVADSGNSTIRKITPATVVTTLAGAVDILGSSDGIGVAARFQNPMGVAIDSNGTIFVADTINHAVRKITPAGVVSTLGGGPAKDGSADGLGADARFVYPLGIAIDHTGNVYVADSGYDKAIQYYNGSRNNSTIRKITSGGIVSTLAGSASESGSTDGTGALARLDSPQGLATDSAGNVYVAEKYNHTIRKITPTGIVTTLAGTAGVIGSTDGVGTAAAFAYPDGIATDTAGNIYVADSGNGSIRTIAPTGVVSRLAGPTGYQGTADGVGAAARFLSTAGITTDSAGNVYLVDSGYFTFSATGIGNTIRKITPAGLVSTLAGNAGVQGSTDGLGTTASFQNPKGIAADSTGNVYVADPGNGTIRKITPAGLVSTLAGTADVMGNADGAGTAASFRALYGIASDSADNLYVADWGTIRKITPAGVVSTVAGTAGVQGSSDGVGVAARFDSLSGIATDIAGTIYVVDGGAIRKVTPTGIVSTLAGSASERGNTDGVGAAARFQYPTGIATDSAGNIYVADSGGNTIRKITPAGVVSTLFGMVVRTAYLEPINLAIRGNTLYISALQGVGVLNLP